MARSIPRSSSANHVERLAFVPRLGRPERLRPRDGGEFLRHARQMSLAGRSVRSNAAKRACASRRSSAPATHAVKSQPICIDRLGLRPRRLVKKRRASRQPLPDSLILSLTLFENTAESVHGLSPWLRERPECGSRGASRPISGRLSDQICRTWLAPTCQRRRE